SKRGPGSGGCPEVIDDVLSSRNHRRLHPARAKRCEEGAGAVRPCAQPAKQLRAGTRRKSRRPPRAEPPRRSRPSAARPAHAHPSLADLSRRVEVLRFRAVEHDVTTARQAAQSGKTDEALRAYRVAIDHSPETGFLYRERGAIEREHGDADLALADFRKALSLDASDAASLVEVAQILDARNEFE